MKTTPYTIKEPLRDRVRRLALTALRKIQHGWCAVAHGSDHKQYWTECTRFFWKCGKCNRYWSTHRPWK